LTAQEILQLLHLGRLTVYPLGLLSVLVFAIVIERAWRYRGLERTTRDLTRRLVDALVRRDLSAARTLCETSKAPMAEVFREGLRWRNIALEDLDQVLGTSRQEVVSDLRRGLWVIGTVGSLAPYIGLLGTVVGIMRAFHDMAREGAGGFEVVAAGISEALVATAVGLLVAILALAFYNYLQVRVGHIAASYSRATERFVQALLYVESGSGSGAAAPEGAKGGSLSPA
jgi:biopolymer transport protein ExbB